MRLPYRSTGLFLIGLLFIPGVYADERDQLALVMHQLDLVQSALERAKTMAAQDSTSNRFYFDYRRATDEVGVIKQGIQNYLEPSRAQPTLGHLSGHYQQEKR